METPAITSLSPASKAQPACPVFGTCGGCAYQDIPYEEELAVKEKKLMDLFALEVGIPADVFGPIVASPSPYHYRLRLDLTVKKKRSQPYLGFQPANRRELIEIDACPIAREEISNAIPRVRDEAFAKLPEDYRTANLVVKVSGDGTVRWGGIGRRSLSLKEEDYIWTDIRGRKIFHSLDTFFQANASILPVLMDKIEELVRFDQNTLFWDLYSGVGLFGFCLAANAGKVIMIEENPAALKLMEYNAVYHHMSHVECYAARVETEFEKKAALYPTMRHVAIVDPPRRGLSPEALEMLSGAKFLNQLLYLSCSPESLARDLKIFVQKGWKIEKVVPFDFFPKSAHLETLVLLKP